MALAHFKKYALLLLLVSTFAFAEEPPKILRVRAMGDPTTLDWNQAHTWAESILIRNIMEGLLGVSSKLKVAPALAQKWTVSKDGKTYTFHLRSGVKWSDGVPLSAQDFVNGWKRLLDPELKATYAYLLSDVEGAEEYHQGTLKDFSLVGIKAPDPLTFVVKLKRPIAYWLWIPTLWCTYPIREDIIQKHKSLWDRPANIVTLGAFVPSAHEPGRSIVLKRNPYYYGKTGNLDQVLFALVHDDATALKLYEVDQLDFVPKISSLAVPQLQGRAEFKVWPELRSIHLKLNTAKGPLKDARVRRAIGMAIDRSKLKNVIAGSPKAATSFVPDQIAGHSAKAGLAFNPQKAKALLKEAGITNPATLNLSLISPAFDDEILLAKFIQSELQKNIGVNLKIEILEPKRYYSPVLNLTDYSMLIAFWVADFPDPDNFYSIFLSSAGNNRYRWENKKYDELVLQARTFSDPKKREKLYREADKLLLEDEAAAIPMYYGRIRALLRSEVKGFDPNPLNLYLFKDVSLHR